jgi:sugar phosphate permease
MPAVFITYSLAYLDRVNFGFAASGMKQDLNLDAGQLALLGALFFLGYFFFQIPGAHYAHKHSAKRLIAWALIAWSILAALTGLLSQFWLLAIDRFALGVAESVIMPAMLVFLTHWFTKAERSRANTFLILGNPVTVLWMSAVTGYLVGGVGWRWMFIIEAIPSFIWAFIWLRLADDHPRQASWIPHDEALELEQALNREQLNISPVRNYWQAFRQTRVVLLSAQYFFWSIGVYGFVIWLPSVIEAGSKQGVGVSGLLTAVPYGLAVILMLLASYYSDRTLERKLFVWPFLLIGAIAFTVSFLIGGNNFWLSFLFLVIAGGCMYAPYGPFFAIVPEILPKNVSGEAMALINSLGALGSFAGAYFVGWLNGVTGGPGAGFMFMAGALVIAVVLTILVKMPKLPRSGRPPMTPANAER